MELHIGPIRHTTLPDGLLARIKAVYDLWGPHTNLTLEQFEIGFMRDVTLTREIVIWERIVKPAVNCRDKYLAGKNLSVKEQGPIFHSILFISMGRMAETTLMSYVPSPKYRLHLINCYRELQ